jgi:hypothetical protein
VPGNVHNQKSQPNGSVSMLRHCARCCRGWVGGKCGIPGTPLSGATRSRRRRLPIARRLQRAADAAAATLGGEDLGVPVERQPIEAPQTARSPSAMRARRRRGHDDLDRRHAALPALVDVQVHRPGFRVSPHATPAWPSSSASCRSQVKNGGSPRRRGAQPQDGQAGSAGWQTLISCHS